MIKARALPWTGMRWPFRRSLSTQLVLWNTVMLALLLGVLGGILRYAVKRTIMASVQRQLEMQTRPHDGPPPDDHGGPGHGPGDWDHGGPGGSGSDHGGTPGGPGPDHGGPAGFGFGPGDAGGPHDVFVTGGPQGGFGPGPAGGPGGFGPGASGNPGSAVPGSGQATSSAAGDRGTASSVSGDRGTASSSVSDDRGFGPDGPMPPLMRHMNDVFHANRKPLDNFFPRMIGMDGRVRVPFTSEQIPVLDRSAFLSAKSSTVPIYDTVTLSGQPVEVISRPFVYDGRTAGVVQAGYPLAGINRALLGLDRVLLVFIPVALLCAAFAGTTLTGQVLRRVRNMTHAAARIGSQNFSERIPVVGHDEFSELAETFNGLLGRLQGAIDQQRRFTADASHELKSPLTIIQGNTGIALSDPSDAEGCREALQEIDRAAETMSVLVRDLLLLARSDAGRLGQQPIELLVSEVVERALVTARRERAACVTVSIPDETLSVRGNEEELIRLFANLLNNARQHTPPDGRITVTARRDGGSVVVAVADTGSGIAPEHLPHLGERFYRVDSARARADGGTGLGLSICKSIAAAHGGDLSIASALGEGTTVTVRLPAAD